MKLEKLKLNSEISEYFNVLSDDQPEWLEDYIYTKEMMRINEIGLNCGTNYSGIYNPPYFFSVLHHSIGVALILWNFTKDKKATLAGLFHDIATPVFRHCIDYLHGDQEHQETTEERTMDIIKNSKEITELLKRDNILVEEIIDYKLYPIADNKTPKLCADRLEYTFSNGLVFRRVFEIEDIKDIYTNISITKNEDDTDELCFNNIDVCKLFVRKASIMWPEWVNDDNRTILQFIADICKVMVDRGYMNYEDLYILSEEEIINKILNESNSYVKNAFMEFQNIETSQSVDGDIPGKYCVNVKSKERYINPLLKDRGRIYDIDNDIKRIVDDYLKIPKSGWSSFDINNIFMKGIN